jgi:hypothetical protein
VQVTKAAMARQARQGHGLRAGFCWGLSGILGFYEATAHSSQADVLFLAPCFRARRFFFAQAFPGKVDTGFPIRKCENKEI